MLSAFSIHSEEQMSTKITLVYNDKIHIYQKIYDESNVYMQLDDGDVSINVKLDVSTTARLCRAFDIPSLRRQAELTNEEILAYVKKTVAARRQSNDFLAEISGMLVFGKCDDSAEQQIERGFKHYCEIRDKVSKIWQSVDSRRVQNFFFGLEEIA